MFAAMRYVRDHVRVDPIANHVALVIATYVKGPTAPCSLRQIASVTGRHTRTVTRAIERLELAGVLAVERRPKVMSVYRFPVIDAIELSTAVAPRGAQVGSRHLRAGGARSVAPRGAHLSVEHLDPRGTFLPGSGWIPRYVTHALNEEIAQ